jgi:uncharacterized protein DUF1918
VAKKGDLIHINAQRVGGPPREGEILEVIEGELQIRYRVRWSDGHESLFAPAAGTVRIEPAPAHRRMSSEGTKPRKSTAKKLTASKPTAKRLKRPSPKRTATKTSTGVGAGKSTVRKVAAKKASSRGSIGKRRTR